jgi:hypothetical protein
MLHVVGNCIEEVEHDTLLTVHFGISHPNKPDQPLLDLRISSTFVCVCFDFSSFAFLSLALQNVLSNMVHFFSSTLHLTNHYTFGTLEQ